MPTEPQQALPTQEQVQAQYDAASQAGVSPCLWIPPQWEELQTRGTTLALPDNSADDTFFKNPQASADARERIKLGDAKRAPEGPERPPNKENWTNPFADFSHVDDDEFSSQNLDTINHNVDPDRDARNMDEVLAAVAEMFEAKRDLIVQALYGKKHLYEKALVVLQGDAFVEPGELDTVAELFTNPGGPVCDAASKLLTDVTLPPWTLDDVVNVLKGTRPDLLKRRNALTQLKHIVGPGSHGMQRLASVFEWALYRTTVLMKDLNDALDKGASGQDDYNEARANYINFLKDLDDRHPEATETPPLDVKDKKARSGYGRAMKWTCIDPVIYRGQIVGVRAVMKWNPHSSSNGVPIPHKP